MSRLVVLLGLLLAMSTAAGAAGLVAVGDERVTQYKEALTAARSVLKGAPVIDPVSDDAVAQLKRAEPSVILAVGQKALTLARSAAPGTPTVFTMVLGATGGGRVTGVKLEVAPATQLQLLKQVHPQVRRLGVIYDPKSSGSYVEEATKVAEGLGLSLAARPVDDARDVRTALGEIAADIDALWLLPDPRLFSGEMFNFLLVFTIEHKIALFGFLDAFTRAGALASVAPDYAESGRRAAQLATTIAKSPGDALPPPVAGAGVLSINLKTAKRLGLEIPQGAIDRAKQVYR